MATAPKKEKVRAATAQPDDVEQDRMLREAGWSAPVGERLDIEKWAVGLVIEGKLLTKKKLPDVGDKKGGHIFTLAETSNGEDTGERCCFGAPTLLWEILEPIPVGTLLLIHCTGKVKTKHQDAWTFTVRHKGQLALDV